MLLWERNGMIASSFEKNDHHHVKEEITFVEECISKLHFLLGSKISEHRDSLTLNLCV